MLAATLRQVAVNFRALSGLSNTSSANLTGYWREIALSAEELAGAATAANATLAGWMLRAAIAVETLEGTDGTAENRNYNGLLKRIVDAMEEGNGAVGTGSLENRLLLASNDWTGGAARIVFTGTIAEGATTGRAVGTATLANPPVDIGTLTWSELGTGTGAALFAIDGSTGAVTNSAALDYETATSYTYGIQVTDGVYTYTLLATISVTDVAEAAYSVIIAPVLGQSNAAGRCGPPSDGLDVGATDVYEWNCTNIDPDYHTLQPVGSILHYINDGNPDLLDLDGPGITYLNKVKTDNPSAIVVAVPVAYGAAALAIGTTTWQSSPTPAAGGPHFEEAVTETLAAITAAKAAWPGCTILVEPYFVQGEQDYANADSAVMTEAATYAAYYAGLASFIPDLRSRITGSSVSHGKFAIGSIVPSTWQAASPTRSIYAAAVNKAHVYASLNIANVTYSPGPTSLDALHYQPASAARTLGLRMATTLSDVTGPSVTTSITQGGYVGSDAPILLEHDDPVGHATFHFAGGPDDALFTMNDAYVDGTTQPTIQLIDNTEVVGSYEVWIRARDGAGNYGTIREIGFEQSEPVVTKSVNFGAWLTGITGGFGTSSGATTTVDVKAGMNLFFLACTGNSPQGALFSGTVNGNACTVLGYVGGGTMVCLGYESAVDITGATFHFNWGAVTIDWWGRHCWLTGYDMSSPATGGHDWGSATGAPHTGASLTCPTGGIIVGYAMSANGFTSAVTGTTRVGLDNHGGGLGEVFLTRDTTGAVSCNGGGNFGGDLSLAFAELP